MVPRPVSRPRTDVPADVGPRELGLSRAELDDFLVLLGQLFGPAAEDDHPEHVVRGDRVLFDGIHDPAVVHDADPVGEVEHVVDVVADQEDPDALVLELSDEAADLGRLGRAERCGRFVHDQDPGVEVDRTGDRHGLALAAGQGLDRLGEVLEVRVEPTHDLARLGLHAGVIEGPHPRRQLSAEEQVAGRVDVVGQRERLIDGLDVVGLRIARVADGHGLLVDQDLAAVGRVSAG